MDAGVIDVWRGGERMEDDKDRIKVGYPRLGVHFICQGVCAPCALHGPLMSLYSKVFLL